MSDIWIMLFGLITFSTRFGHTSIANDTGNDSEGPDFKDDGDATMYRKKSSYTDANDDSPDKVVLTVNTGDILSNTKYENAIDILEAAMKYFFKAAPQFRSRLREKGFKRNVVFLRNNKPAIVIELNSDTIIKTIGKILTSKTVIKYAEDLAHKIASFIRNIRAEIKDE